MKTKLLLLISFLAIAVSARSQEQSAPVPVVTAARILGPIPDGTPPPPAPPKPEFIVPAKDILAITTHQQGGRTITVREIKPIALPPPPSGAGVPPAADAEFGERLAAYHDENPHDGLLFLGATIFRSAHRPPRSLVRYWPLGKNADISFWSSADFALIADGIGSFIDTTGAVHSIFMSHDSVDADNPAKLQAATASDDQALVIPNFPEGKATFQVIGEQPEAEQLVAIQSLHDLYNSEFHRLRAAHEGREQARLQQEAYLRSHPPQPKNLTLNYWRTEKPATTRKGGNQP